MTRRFVSGISVSSRVSYSPRVPIYRRVGSAMISQPGLLDPLKITQKRQSCGDGSDQQSNDFKAERTMSASPSQLASIYDMLHIVLRVTK